MSIVKKEPALLAGAGAVIAVLVAYNLVTPEQAEAWNKVAVLLLVPIAQALLTRSAVFSRNTIEQAGLSPDEVQRRAEDPMTPPFKEPSRG